MAGFYLTITTEDEEHLWNVHEAPAVPDVGELVRVSEADGEKPYQIKINAYRVIRREWIWQEHNRTFNVACYVEPIEDPE